METGTVGYFAHSAYAAYIGDADHYQDNIYTADQWRVMEAAGAVFLPAAGYFENGKIEHANEKCYYWAQDDDSWGDGYCLEIEWKLIQVESYHKHFIYCVRLVH